MKSLLPRPSDRIRILPGTILGLSVAMTFLAAATPANAFNPTFPQVVPQASEGCCATDEDSTFRGYTVETWDEAPTVSALDCPDQDDTCLLNEADQISRVYRLHQALVRRAALERAQHFSKGPFVAEAFAVQ